MWTGRLNHVDNGFGQSLAAMVLGELLDGLSTGPHHALLARHQLVQERRVIDRGEDRPVSGRRTDTDLPVSQRLFWRRMISTVDGEGFVAAGVDIPQVPAVRPVGTAERCDNPEPTAVRVPGPQHRTDHGRAGRPLGQQAPVTVCAQVVDGLHGPFAEWIVEDPRHGGQHPPRVRPAVRLPGTHGADGLHSGVDDRLGEHVRADMIVDRGVVQLGQRPSDSHAKLVFKIGIRSRGREPDQLRDHRLGRRRGEGRSALVQLPPVLGEPRHRGGQFMRSVGGSGTQCVRLRPGLPAGLAALLALAGYRHCDRIDQRAKHDADGITDCAPLVAFSGTLTLDGIDYTEPKLNGFSEAALPAAFGYTKVDDPQAAARNQTEYRILVVAEKYQTGFDQPLLTAMYVDKPLTGVAAVQTLSRLNRIHRDKSQDDVFVLDFANDAEDIQRAFKPYFETTITEPTDPNLLYDKQREAMDYQLLVDSEMDAFVEALLAAEASSATENQLEMAHAGLYRFLQPVVDRFTELASHDRDRAAEFRSSLSDYVRAYGFLAQVVGYADPDLERLYLYGRFLLRRLPHEPGAGVDIGETTLSHLRIDKTGKHDLALHPRGGQLIPGFSPDGGVAREVEEKPLSEVIEELNERFGLDLSSSDQILMVQQIISLAEDEKLQAVALNNDIDKFGQVADPELDNIVARNHDRNSAFVGRYFDNPEFQAAARDEARRRAYNLIVSPARTEALRKL